VALRAHRSGLPGYSALVNHTPDSSPETKKATTREGVDPATVTALGKLTEAVETIERARGHLYAFHQLTGHGDFALSEAAGLLAEAGHHRWAERISTELVGRNVLPERWTFQVVEEYEDCYYRPCRDLEEDALAELAGGRRHLHEAELKRRRRTSGRPGHEFGQDTTANGSS
jgi:hypothetical protein